MFGKIISMDMLARMPLPFVHRLRDIRIKQIQEANKQQEQQMQRAQQQQKLRANANTARRAYNQNYQQTQHRYAGPDPAMFNGTALDDLIDELT